MGPADECAALRGLRKTDMGMAAARRKGLNDIEKHRAICDGPAKRR